jgi:uncharacterized repeat protein (TIGR03803 family)
MRFLGVKRRFRMKNTALVFVGALLSALLCGAPAHAQGPSEVTIYGFPHAGNLGFSPSGALITDAAGNLYGTTATGGTPNFYGVVYELVKPVAPATKWTEQVLYNFAGGSADGEQPVSELIFDSAGNLYGTTKLGGPANAGTVFELSPNGDSTWSENVLYFFKGQAAADGANPFSGVVFDNAGNLYGTTHIGDPVTGGQGCGIVFQLVPPSTPGANWTENILHQFASSNGCYPVATPVIDHAGNLYGTATGGGKNGTGAVFRMTPPSAPGGTWGYHSLYFFGPPTGTDGKYPQGLLLHDASLYGVTQTGGVNSAGELFELAGPSPGSSTWTYSVLWNFGSSSTDGQLPVGRPILDQKGNLWGATSNGGGNGTAGCTYNGCGTVYELTPGAGGWTETIVHAFPANPNDGANPPAGLVQAPNGLLFGVTVAYAEETGGLAFGVSAH